MLSELKANGYKKYRGRVINHHCQLEHCIDTVFTQKMRQFYILFINVAIVSPSTVQLTGGSSGIPKTSSLGGLGDGDGGGASGGLLTKEQKQYQIA